LATTPRASAGQADSPPPPGAALEAYEAARFDEAARLWLSAGPYETLTADTLYNIGNASYRLGSPGHAALYYRRALLRDATHAEARQNLRFIERKVGAVTINRPNYQYALARVPLAAWQNAVAASAWGFVLALLIFPATRRTSGWRLPAIAGLVLAPLVATCAGLAWRYYPDDAEFAPPSRQAVVIDAGTLLHTEASRTAPEVIEAPPGSLLEILKIRGEWAYVGFATGTRGWIPMETVEKIIPVGTPEPPALRKPRADGTSA
jgi:tetratricopeptide (TPR) repeat protein